MSTGRILNEDVRSRVLFGRLRKNRTIPRSNESLGTSIYSDTNLCCKLHELAPYDDPKC